MKDSEKLAKMIEEAFKKEERREEKIKQMSQKVPKSPKESQKVPKSPKKFRVRFPESLIELAKELSVDPKYIMIYGEMIIRIELLKEKMRK
jgi:ABC-type Fe3+-hydroxamate transport system substrate-binding protein